MSPIATQPAPSTLPPCHSATVPLPAAAPSTQSPAPSQSDRAALLSFPVASILSRFQVDFTHVALECDPMDPKVRPWIEQYAMLQQAALCERLHNLLQENIEYGPGELKLIKLLLQALTVQEKTAARRDRAKRDANKEARDQAKKAKDQLRLQNAQKEIDRAKETLDRLNNLNHAGAIETPAPAAGSGPKDATVPAQNENAQIEVAEHTPSSTLPLCHSATSPLPQDATVPAQIENPTLIPAAAAS